jgi:dGTPase
MNKIHINERVRELLLDGEKSFSPFAKKSNETLGRRFPITPDILRLEFSRDENRILHSLAFRRLKHKAQVFLSPVNDHVCTRIEHVLYVASISSTIGRGLSLNNDLIRAISIGHDIGHSPFGHVGEQALDEALKNRGYINGFKHEIHGLRVVDRAANFGEGLNLTYEVRDGILNHCGESYDRVLQPDREKDLTKLHEITNRDFLPSTLEGCLVRMVDRISYLGRDLEDALKNGMVKKRTIPKEIKEKIGTNNGNIIGYFVSDIIMNSVGEDKIEK